MEAGHFMQTTEADQDLKVAYLQEIAYRQARLGTNSTAEKADKRSKNVFVQYFQRIPKKKPASSTSSTMEPGLIDR